MGEAQEGDPAGRPYVRTPMGLIPTRQDLEFLNLFPRSPEKKRAEHRSPAH